MSDNRHITSCLPINLSALTGHPVTSPSRPTHHIKANFGVHPL